MKSAAKHLGQSSEEKAIAGKETMGRSEYNVVSLTLGIIGTIIGVLALLGAWIPQLGLAAIPFCIIGIALSGIGIGYALMKQFKAIELPILGVLICITAITLSIVSTYLAKVAVINEARIEAAQAQKQAKDEAAATLQRKQKYRNDQIATFKARIPQLEYDCAEAEKEFEIIQSQYNQIYAECNSFITDKPYLTNEVYREISRRYETARQENLYWQAMNYQQQLEQIVQTAASIHESKLNDAQAKLNHAQANLDDAKGKLTSARSSLEFFQTKDFQFDN